MSVVQKVLPNNVPSIGILLLILLLLILLLFIIIFFFIIIIIILIILITPYMLVYFLSIYNANLNCINMHVMHKM